MGPNVSGEPAGEKKAGLFRRKKKESKVASPSPVSEAEVDPNVTRLLFRLRINAGGLIGPMVNAVMGPVLKPIAEDFGGKMRARLEEIAAARN